MLMNQKKLLQNRPIHRHTLCIHTHVHTYIHTYVHTYTRTYIHTYIHTPCTYIHTYIHTHVHTYLSHKYFRLLSGNLILIMFFTDSCGNVNFISTCVSPSLRAITSACRVQSHARSSCDSRIALTEQSNNFCSMKCTALVVLTVPLHSSTGK
jgi:hypothetical protein